MVLWHSRWWLVFCLVLVIKMAGDWTIFGTCIFHFHGSDDRWTLGNTIDMIIQCAITVFVMCSTHVQHAQCMWEMPWYTTALCRLVIHNDSIQILGTDTWALVCVMPGPGRGKCRPSKVEGSCHTGLLVMGTCAKTSRQGSRVQGKELRVLLSKTETYRGEECT